MPAFLNALGAVSRRGQWRFREILRTRRADGRVDLSDAGLIDFSYVSAAVLTVTPRAPARRWGWGLSAFLSGGCDGYGPEPVFSASLAAGTLRLLNPGIVEAVFPAGSLLGFPSGLYDVRITVTVGPETAEVYDEPVEFA